MEYMINIDLETRNVSGGGTDCQLTLHNTIGPHYDLTVHVLGCGSRSSRSVQRPPTRYWDDNSGRGYTLQQAIDRILALCAQHANAHARRCRNCGVETHVPEWD